jgi:glucokinase
MEVLGVDIGGTKLAAGVVNVEGRILTRAEVPTRAVEGPKRVLDRIVQLAEKVLARTETSHVPVRRIGIGCAGPVDRKAGLILDPPNLPGWTQVPLVEHFEQALGLPVVLENDANAAALGEFRYGAGKGAQSLVYLTVSTGIGGGIILDGKIWHGLKDAAGEIGHMTLLPDGPLCGCGSRGCLEALASGPSIVRRARELLAAGRDSRLRDLGEFTSTDIARLAQEADLVAGEVWQSAVRFLALGVTAAITILAPERVVIGGGVTRAGDLLFEPLRREVKSRVRLVSTNSVPLLPAALGADVGILGAAAVALEP